MGIGPGVVCEYGLILHSTESSLLVGSSLISMFSAGLAAWLGGFRGLDGIHSAHKRTGR
jgi:hypothetical protein